MEARLARLASNVSDARSFRSSTRPQVACVPPRSIARAFIRDAPFVAFRFRSRWNFVETKTESGPSPFKRSFLYLINAHNQDRFVCKSKKPLTYSKQSH